MYRLYMDSTLHRVYRDLPDKARAKVAQFLLDSASDPRAVTNPYGDVDDGVMRLWAAGDLAVVLLVGDETRTVTVLSIAYAGLD
jgi:mRNA-degrading endonuclease RelE of RelBE toxin-antitoxin system